MVAIHSGDRGKEIVTSVGNAVGDRNDIGDVDDADVDVDVGVDG